MERTRYALPSYLEAVQRAFATDPGVDFVYTDAWTFDDGARRVCRTDHAHYLRQPSPAPATAVELFHELLERNFMIVPVAVRRNVLAALGMFDEMLTAVEDWEMWLRLAASGHRAAEAPGPLALRREHPAQMSLDPLRMIDNHVLIFEKMLARYPLSGGDLKLVAAKLAEFRKEQEAIRSAGPLRSMSRHARYRLARLRRRFGRGWYETPPAAVASAFPDLRQI